MAKKKSQRQADREKYVAGENAALALRQLGLGTPLLREVITALNLGREVSHVADQPYREGLNDMLFGKGR